MFSTAFAVAVQQVLGALRLRRVQTGELLHQQLPVFSPLWSSGQRLSRCAPAGPRGRQKTLSWEQRDSARRLWSFLIQLGAGVRAEPASVVPFPRAAGPEFPLS